MHRVLIVVFLCAAALNTIAEKCLTPNREIAECISLYNCSLLLDALRTLEPESVQFVQKSQCGYDAHPLVCCGSAVIEKDWDSLLIINGQTVPKDGSSNAEALSDPNSKMSLLPDKRYCGYQHFDDYFHNENFLSTSSIDEFPWMAVLIYQINGTQYDYGCTGSLISKRYVLTAGLCVYSREVDLIMVRLGEYNIEKDEDCLKSEHFYECTDPVADFGVEEIIVHPGLNYRTRQNDIGLIRLNKIVSYTDFIRPICLPFPGTKQARIGDHLFLSGWGGKSFSERAVDVKKKISAELGSLEECRSAFNTTVVVLTDNHTCMKETKTAKVFSCQSDSGGPVMFSHRKQWHQEGTVSFGNDCGGKYPTVNIKVSNYLNWILNNIRQ